MPSLMALAVEARCNKTSLCSAVNKLRSMKEFSLDPLSFFIDSRSPGCLVGFANIPISIIDLDVLDLGFRKKHWVSHI